MYCTRCHEQRPLSEWKYMPMLHAWRHVGVFVAVIEDMDTGEGGTAYDPCGWIEKIPMKIQR